MFNSEFWMTLFSIVLFILGMIGGMLIDYITEKRAVQKAYVKQLEADNKKLKAKLSFYKSLLEDKKWKTGFVRFVVPLLIPEG